MKRLIAIIPLLLIACGTAEETTDTQSIECALSGAAGFAEDCTMERADSEEQRLLVVRHPDGGFRRFELGVPGRGIITADGVEQAEVERGDGVVEVRVGSDRYRLPVAAE